jgi:hypothetical protein
MSFHKTTKSVNWPNIAFILMLLINIVYGYVTIGNRGMSWDEPLFYNYADSIGYAYSISARLNGTFDLNKAYGISPDEHKQYGPAYLLISKPFTSIIEGVLRFDEEEAWHFVNFLTFQIGILGFYLLCKRWMHNWVAFITACFFATQPLLVGHSFINPKDIPFTVYFIISVYFGFRMVDSISISQRVSWEYNPRQKIFYSTIRKINLVLASIGGAVTIFLYAFGTLIYSLIENLILYASSALSDSFWGRIFNRLAPNAETLPIILYINKAVLMFNRIRTIWLEITIMLIVITLIMIFLKSKRKLVMEIYQEIICTKVSMIMLGLAGLFVGLTTSIRILGPFAGILICIYLLTRHGRCTLGIIGIYGFIAILVSYTTWPYIWAAPISNFFNVFMHMSDNSTAVAVLFNGVATNSVSLPVTYMPTLLILTLTEPMWPLLILGIVFLAIRLRCPEYGWKELLVPLGWFLIPFFYVIIRRPPMYDGIRHFLFILPGAFLVVGLGFQAIYDWIKIKWLAVILIIALLFPGLIGIIKSTPYEYAYFNSFIGGIQGAFRKYDTDYWLTCYEKTMQYINENSTKNTIVYVFRNPVLAKVYAEPGIDVQKFQRNPDNTTSGSLLLLTTRTNFDLVYHADAPIFYQTGNGGAIFCVVKIIK